MRKAEERAKEAFPKSDWFNENRSAYIKGYEQAEKDLIKQPTSYDRGMVEEIILNLKRVESDYMIDLTKEMEWLRNQVR